MIKLSKMADYAVVTLSALAEGRGQRMSASTLAEKTGLPEPTVAKVLKMLGKALIVDSERGANGGYALIGKIENIGILQVIRATDGPLAIASCVDTHDGACCSHEKSCPVKGKWNPVNEAIVNALANVTLADMVR
jgi:FeS assembly SUF system regulator